MNFQSFQKTPQNSFIDLILDVFSKQIVLLWKKSVSTGTWDLVLKDILVSYLGKRGKTDGFLTRSGVIRGKSHRIECLINQTIIAIKNLIFIKYKNFVSKIL